MGSKDWLLVSKDLLRDAQDWLLVSLGFASRRARLAYGVERFAYGVVRIRFKMHKIGFWGRRIRFEMVGNNNVEALNFDVAHDATHKIRRSGRNRHPLSISPFQSPNKG